MAIFSCRCGSARRGQASAMPGISLQASLPWSVTHEEDRRFRAILLQTLAVSLCIGAITPYIPLPPPDAGLTTELPPRRVRFITELPRPVSKPVPFAPVVSQPPRPHVRPQPATIVPALTPRQKAAKSGVLALGEALSELQARTPKTGTSADSEYTNQPAYTDPHQPSVLSADITRGSGGIAGGVSHQSVLGPTGLPEREVIRPGSSGPDGGAATEGQASAATTAGVRNQEAIQELLDRSKGAMYTLYNRELRRDASLQGKLLVSITIAPAGHVTRCVILSSELGSVSLEQQLVALIKGIDFGHLPGAAVVTTKIPIEFFPR